MNWDLQHIDKAIHRAIWTDPAVPMAPWKRRILAAIRLVVVVLRDLLFGQLTLRAMSLVYTTLLSLVPLLALSFSVLKGFGVHNQLEPMLHRFFLPLGGQGEQVVAYILDFIENLNVGVLGAVGLAFLLYTAVSLVHKTEASINYIWHVRRPRSFGERFSSYVTMLLIGPVLVFTALGLTATVTGSDQMQQLLAVEPIGRLFASATRLVPYLLVIAAFTFAYFFLPSVRVRIRYALIGGVVGGVLWQSAGWAFAGFVSGAAQYEAIYASFAVLVFFLIWVYVSWLILLLGASVAFYLQNPQYVVLQSGEPRLSNRMRERLALLVMSLVARRHLEGGAALTRDDLAQGLSVPVYAVDVVVDALRDGGVLVEGADPPCSYLPARDLGSVTLAHVLDIVRSAGEERFLGPGHMPVPAGLEELLRRLDAATRSVMERVTVRDLGIENMHCQPDKVVSHDAHAAVHR